MKGGLGGRSSRVERNEEVTKWRRKKGEDKQEKEEKEREIYIYIYVDLPHTYHSSSQDCHNASQ